MDARTFFDKVALKKINNIWGRTQDNNIRKNIKSALK